MIRYSLDPARSKLTFTVKHLMFSKVRGEFKILGGTFEFDKHQPPNSRVEVSVDVSSVRTQDESRDTYLKSSEFFNPQNFPTILFKSTHFKKQSVEGELAIRGVTRVVHLKIEGPDKDLRVKGSAQIKRKDFDLTWSAALEAGGFLVGDDISISFEVQLQSV